MSVVWRKTLSSRWLRGVQIAKVLQPLPGLHSGKCLGEVLLVLLHKGRCSCSTEECERGKCLSAPQPWDCLLFWTSSEPQKLQRQEGHTEAWTERAGAHHNIVAPPKILVWAKAQAPLPQIKLYQRDGFKIFLQNLPYCKNFRSAFQKTDPSGRPARFFIDSQRSVLPIWLEFYLFVCECKLVLTGALKRTDLANPCGCCACSLPVWAQPFGRSQLKAMNLPKEHPGLLWLQL